ncbi:hypothetical protein PAXRUDRAFT_395257 [Paxillus rubicundulus Ve08.2h10]|uniref:Uncharacterized protein n=1 Tax=Paxillus rubicundulus Ve08.2h10 TaxID=930991 RepID=A0A0D0EA47_9AGAM|nr:hypothetical protein PAXRUDRAFT_395257 [Paxillus rubicundulus Ve08.2h10]
MLRNNASSLYGSNSRSLGISGTSSRTFHLLSCHHQPVGWLRDSASAEPSQVSKALNIIDTLMMMPWTLQPSE